MFSKRFATEMWSGKTKVEWLTPLDAEKGSHAATMKCLDAMSALAALHRYATEYAVAAQQSLESDLEVEDGVGQQGAANADAEGLAEAKQGFEFALERFRNTVARLSVNDPS